MCDHIPPTIWIIKQHYDSLVSTQKIVLMLFYRNGLHKRNEESFSFISVMCLDSNKAYFYLSGLPTFAAFSQAEKYASWHRKWPYYVKLMEMLMPSSLVLVPRTCVLRLQHQPSTSRGNFSRIWWRATTRTSDPWRTAATSLRSPSRWRLPTSSPWWVKSVVFWPPPAGSYRLPNCLFLRMKRRRLSRQASG